MKFLTDGECVEWSARNAFGDRPGYDRLPFEQHEIMIPMAPLWSRTAWFSRFLASSLGEFDECLLWVTQTGVWPSSENLPLVQRLRSSFGNVPSLDDAPGSIFSVAEEADLASFVQVSLLCVWDFHILATASKVRLFNSHDEFVHMYFRDGPTVSEVRDQLSLARVSFEVKS